MALVLSNAAFATDPAPPQRVLPAVMAEPATGQPGGRVTTPATGRVQVWVDLAMPPLAQVPMPRPSLRNVYHHALQAQQGAVSEQLRTLGATELARVYWVRNAIAAELPASAVDAARQLPGVLRVRPVTHPNRIDPPPPTQ